MIRRVVGAVSALAVAVGVGWALAPAPAVAGTGPRTVYVQESVTGKTDWALRESVRWVDKYTASRMVIGKCRGGHKCIRVSVNVNTNRYAGWTHVRSGATEVSGTTEIRINPWAVRNYGRYTMRALLDHELGHVYGLRHNPKCTSRAYAPLKCGKGLSPRTWTANERRILGLF